MQILFLHIYGIGTSRAKSFILRGKLTYLWQRCLDHNALKDSNVWNFLSRINNKLKIFCYLLFVVNWCITCLLRTTLCYHAHGRRISCLTVLCFYTPRNEVRGGGGILDSPCLSLSVRLSVCPLTFRVRPVVSTVRMDSFHIWCKWSIAWEGVSHVMNFDLDLYLQGHSALT